jgi:hypothetical protein
MEHTLSLAYGDDVLLSLGLSPEEFWAEAKFLLAASRRGDEQPYPLKVPGGELHALPAALPLDDVNALWTGGLIATRWGKTSGRDQARRIWLNRSSTSGSRPGSEG